MTLKMTIPLLIAMLLVPAGINGITAQTVQNESTLELELTAYEKSMLESPSLKDVSEEVKIDFIKNLREFRNNLSGYDAKIVEKLDELAIADLKLKEANNSNKDEKTIQKYESQKALKIFELEDLGVPSQERLEANPQYWTEKAIESKKRIESNNTQPVIGTDRNDDIYFIHSSDSALKRVSILWVPCWNEGFQVSCPNLNWGWNVGTTTAFWWIPTDGIMSFGSQICNDSDINHDTINYNMRIEREIISIFQTTVYDFDNTTSESLDADRYNCDNTTFYKSVNAGSRTELSTSISNIFVTG